MRVTTSTQFAVLFTLVVKCDTFVLIDFISNVYFHNCTYFAWCHKKLLNDWKTHTKTKYPLPKSPKQKFHYPSMLVFQENGANTFYIFHSKSFTSAILISASVYCKPFWIILSKAAGGTKAPLMLDWLMWLSIPNV